MWASNLHLLPSHVYSFSVAAMFDEAAPDRPYAFTRDWFHDIWLVPHKVAGGVCLSALAIRRCLQRRPRQGCNRDGWETVLWHVFCRIETVLSLETPISHVKLAQAKVERFLTLLCMKGDHRFYDLQFYFLFYASMLDISTVAQRGPSLTIPTLCSPLVGTSWKDLPYG